MNLNYNAGFKPIRGMVMTPPDLARAKNDAFCEQNNLFTVNKIFCGRCGVKNACQTWQNMQSASRARWQNIERENNSIPRILPQDPPRW